MSEGPRYWVAKNDYGFICRGCGVAHEFYSVGCFPVVFTDPEEWQLIERTLVETAAGVDLRVLGHALGRLVELTPGEAARLVAMPPRRPAAPWDYLAALDEAERRLGLHP